MDAPVTVDGGSPAARRSWPTTAVVVLSALVVASAVGWLLVAMGASAGVHGFATEYSVLRATLPITTTTPHNHNGASELQAEGGARHG